MSEAVGLLDIPDAEMREAVALYAEVCGRYPGGHVEARMELPFIDSGTLRGTADFWALDSEALTVIDFKYGHGWVEVLENIQLLAYAVLIWMTRINCWTPGIVRLMVVQPRANHPDGPVRTWEFNGELLRNYYNILSGHMAAASVPEPVTVAGEYCRYCRAITDCHTNRRAAWELTGTAFEPAEQSELTDTGLSTELSATRAAVDLLTHRLTALEALTESRLKTGSVIPGYRMIQTTSPLSWDVGDPVQAARDINVDISAPIKPWTPTQVIQKKLLTREQVGVMASRKAGGMKLKKDDINFARRIIENGR